MLKRLVVCIGLAGLILTEGFGPEARASTQNELRGLLTAKSVQDLDGRLRSTASSRFLLESCATELRMHLLPRSCFGRAKQNESAKPGAPSLSELTRICVENAKSSSSRLDLGASLRDLPQECQRASTQRLEDLLYVDTAERPEAALMSVIRTRVPDPDTNLEDETSD